PFREAEFDIIYGEGVSREGDLLDLGVMKGLLEKSGTWISYKGERLGQGRENARVFLRENPEIRAKIDHDLRKALGLAPLVAEKPAPEAEKPAPKAIAAAAQGRSAR
ncbi:MAG: recombinase RecA, partial [Candidatus Acidiferrales bacterium]